MTEALLADGQVVKTRKKPVRLPLNDFGKLMTKIRIDQDLTLTEFANEIGISPIILNKVERGGNLPTLDIVKAVYPFIPAQYLVDFRNYVIWNLGVLLIPQDASTDTVHTAWFVLNNKPQVKPNEEVDLTLETPLQTS